MASRKEELSALREGQPVPAHRIVQLRAMGMHSIRFEFVVRLLRSGPHKGTSAYERLTGQRVEDWLSILGYPPSNTQN